MPIASAHADRKVHLGFLVDQLDNDPKTVEMEWGKFCNYFLLNHEESPCALPGVDPVQGDVCVGAKCTHKSRSCVPKKPMAFIPGVCAGRRLDRNIRVLSLLVLDFDHLRAAEAVQVEAAIGAAGVECAIYTTHNHRPPDDVAFRAVVLLSRPVGADQWHRFLPAAIARLGVSVVRDNGDGTVTRSPDPVCKNRSRLYYMPSHPRGADHGAVLVTGALLDVDEVLAWAVGEGASQVAPQAGLDDADLFSDREPLPEETPWLEADAREVARAAAVRFPLKRRNEFCLALAGMLRRAGADRDTAYAIVHAAAHAGGSDAPDERAKVVDHTYAVDEDAPMTGFGRLAEIIGEVGARAVGDAITDAHNEALLRDLEPASVQTSVPDLAYEPGDGGGHGGDAPAGGEAEPPPIPTHANGYANGYANGHASPPLLAIPFPPPLPVALPVEAALDLGELRRLVSAAASAAARPVESRDRRVSAVVLRRALDGAALARAGGVGDPETIREGASAGMAPEVAVRSVAGSIAFAAPEGTPFEAVLELIRAALFATPEAPAGGWVEAARAMYRRAQRTRRARDLEARRAAETFKKAVIAAATPAPTPPPIPHSHDASGGGDGDGPPIGPPPIPAFPPDDPPDPDDPNSESWKDQLRKRGDGSLVAVPHNARVILERDPLLKGAIAWNDVTKRVEVRRLDGPLGRYAGVQPIESVASAVQDLLASAWDIAIPYSDVARRVVAVARRKPFDPIQDYLKSIKWDGVPRVQNWLAMYCGAEDNEYTREVARRWIVGLVARGIRPGTKCDHILVLEGLTGLGKSTYFEILGGEHFCDTAIALGDKDSRMLAGRYWICELAELVAFKRTGHDAMKTFLSARTDKFRPPYAHGLEEFPRRCLFVGTTNNVQGYLTDEEGNRRYLCVECVFSEEAVARLRRDRDQLLAEAVAIYCAADTCPACRDGSERCVLHRWWFSFKEIAITEEEADKRMVESPVRHRVEAWWFGMDPSERPDGFTTTDVAIEALEILPGNVRDGQLMAVGHALHKLKTPSGAIGFHKRRDPSGLRAWRYYATDEMKAVPKRTNGRRGSLFALPAAPLVPKGQHQQPGGVA